MIYKTTYSSPIGNLTLAGDGENLTGCWLDGQKYFAATIHEEIVKNDSLEIFVKTKSWLTRYFTGKRPEISELRLAPAGTDFRQEVWKILCKIPYGEVTTYAEIAEKIAKQKGLERMSAQAVGSAVGHNPISIIIPCHRVIGKNGSLTGYAGGIENKINLLKLEKVDMTSLFIPKN